MQTLTAGSFLNLESAEKVEALKFTARRLAEHSASVLADAPNAASLENLSNSLWEKAEYVARETERRRLHQIFNENFSERFRELKPAVAKAQNSSFEVSPDSPPIGNAGSTEASSASPIAESVENESATTGENVSLSVSPVESDAVVEGKKDKFLGFVEPGEPFGGTSTVQVNETATNAPKEVEPIIFQTDVKLDVELPNPENQSTTKISNSINQVVEAADRSASPTSEVTTAAKTGTKMTAEIKPTTIATVSAASTGKNAANTTDAKETFEFERCTINLNLTLLPAESGKMTRKIIVGTVSHNLPPEIDFLEINEGGDLTQIADAVREKLARFKQTLPVKYIEQLRQSKNKSAKKSATTKTTAAVAAPTQPAVNQANAAKESGEQKAGEASITQTETPRPEASLERSSTVATSSAVPQPRINQSVAANNIQGSLF